MYNTVVYDHSHKSKPNHSDRYANIDDCFPLAPTRLTGTKSLRSKEAGDRAKKTAPMSMDRRIEVYRRSGRKVFTPRQARRAVKKNNRNAFREDV